MKRSSLLIGAIAPLLLVVLAPLSANPATAAIGPISSFEASIDIPRTAPAAASSLVLGAAPGIVKYGTRSTLTGQVHPAVAGTRIDIFAKAAADSGYSKVASVSTTRGGTYTLAVSPRTQTRYRAEYQSGSTRVVSSIVTRVAVRPAVALEVTLVRNVRLHFTVQVTSTRPSYEGKYVLVQRKGSAGRWITIKGVTLGANSTARFSVRIVVGDSPIRALLTTSQAGPGYVSSASRTIDAGGYRIPIME